ncbi:MAG: flagellar brake protein, partial [Syntrophomonadaceae bacterium]
MKADDLKVNQLIEIEVEELQDIMYLPSRIEEVEDGFIHVSVPMYRGAIVPMRVGQMARVRFNYNDSTYVFSSPITARKWNKIPLLILKKPQEFTKIQRRGHWRIDV